MHKALLILIAIALASPAPAAVYRCREKKGVLILTDDPDNFPPGCKPEGPQGETTVPPGGGNRPAVSPAPAPPAGRTEGRGETPGRESRPPPRSAPAEQNGEGPPPGSSGIPPGLNQPTRPAPPPAGAPGTAGQGTTTARPGASPQQSGVGIVGGPELAQWTEEARALNREYLEAQAGPPPLVGAADPRREIENRIDAFLTRLDNSPLSAQERTVVENELPPRQ